MAVELDADTDTGAGDVVVLAGAEIAVEHDRPSHPTRRIRATAAGGKLVVAADALGPEGNPPAADHLGLRYRAATAALDGQSVLVQNGAVLHAAPIGTTEPAAR